MEPQLPSPNVGPQRPSSAERITPSFTTPEAPTSSPSPERQETRETQPMGPTDPAPQIQPAAPPPLPQLNPQPHTSQQTQPADDNPVVAADEDLIEKEWVEKAKKVISETKHDPYLQEQAVSKLQADYLQKRYNKTVKVPGSGS